MSKLSQPEIEQQLGSLPGWSYQDGCLTRHYSFADFAEAFAFTTRLALLAEKADHHPDIDIRYNQLRVALVSHDAGGVTQRDIAMAGKIGKLVP
jgi:4a-hydroxytetrahydrobiopterin dehydratase